MVYPGDDSLDPTVQQRVLTAFAEAVRLHREGHSEESRTILRSIAEGDPRFGPARGRGRATGEIQTHITRVRDALDAGLTEEARGFLKLAKDIDPSNPEVAVLERRLELAAKTPATGAEPEFEFEVFDHLSEVAASPALPMPAAAPPPNPPPARPPAGAAGGTPAPG